MKLHQIYREVAVIQADGACKFTWKTIKNKWITVKHIQSNFTLILLITSEVLNQTSPN